MHGVMRRRDDMVRCRIDQVHEFGMSKLPQVPVSTGTE